MGTILQALVVLIVIGLFIYSMLKEKEEPFNIAIYSGSFNPLHIGHKTVIKTLSKRFDWVYLIVTPQNPLKEEITVSSEERSNNAREALLKNEFYNVSVNDIERELLPPYYTINTLNYLKNTHTNTNLTLVIGADNLTNIKEWNHYKEILKEFGVLVFPRGHEDIEYLENLKNDLLNEDSEYKIEIEHTITPNISSTEIRNAIKNGENVENLLM